MKAERHEMAVVGGRLFDLKTPNPAQVDYMQISWSLAGKGRYNDHSPIHWPVSTHALCCAILCAHHHALGPAQFCGDALPATRAALHHDDGEAYYGDVTRPVAEFCGPDYRLMRGRVDTAIAVALKLDVGHLASEEVKMYDLLMLEAERSFFFPEPEKEWNVTEMVKDEPLLPLAKKLVARLAQTPIPREDEARRLRAVEKMLVEYSIRNAPVELLTDLLVIAL